MFITLLRFILASPSLVWRNNRNHGLEVLGSASRSFRYCWRGQDCWKYCPALIRLTNPKAQVGCVPYANVWSAPTWLEWPEEPSMSAATPVMLAVSPSIFIFASYCLFFYLVGQGKAQGCGLGDMHQENNNNRGSFVAVKSARNGSFFILV